MPETQVVPASLDPTATVITGEGLYGGVAGQQIVVRVTPKDALGNDWREGPLLLDVSAVLSAEDTSLLEMELPVSADSLADGSYRIYYSSETVTIARRFIEAILHSVQSHESLF